MKIVFKTLSYMLSTCVLILACFCLSGVSPAAAAEVSYDFKPPQNNFFVKWMENGSTYFFGYINGEIWEYTGGSNVPTFLTSQGKLYEYYDNKWKIDSERYDSPEDIKTWMTEAITAPPMLSQYYTRFWERYNQMAGGQLNPKLYHLGKERFLGIECDIFKDNLQIRYWIDPSNGSTLKMVAGGETIEVLEYNLNFTAWPAGIPSGK
jgi:hypothetical protein